MLPNPPLFTGGPSETRTPNLLIKSAFLDILTGEDQNGMKLTKSIESNIIRHHNTRHM